MSTAERQSSLNGIPPGEIRQEYQRRGLATWSDRELVAEVSRIVARPRLDPANSFVLHAPLELAARHALLPWVGAEHRELARLHIVALASTYQAYDPLPEPSSSPADLDAGSALRDLADAVAAGDLDRADRAAAAAAGTATPSQLVAGLTDFTLPLTGAAAHAPIFLYHYSRVSPRGELSAELLRPLTRELARRPEWRLGWIDARAAASEPTDTEALTTALEQAPTLGIPGSSFIHPLLMQVDETGTAADHLDRAVGVYSDTAARAVLRVAARSMLGETPEHAPYGWTHCLTLPQAALGLVHHSADPGRALAVAATHVLAFRAALGTGELPPLGSLALPAVDPTDLATAAATSHDAHIVKYALGCLDAAAFDPSAADLYLAAGRHLLDVWENQGGDPSDPLA